MMKIFTSEWMKTKRTPVRWLAFLTPFIIAVLIIGYFSLRKTLIDIQISIFQTFFEVWTALAIPLGAGLISGLMIHQEELAGGFIRLLGSKLPRRDLYLGKLMMLIFLTLTSTLLAVSALAVGLWFKFNVMISWSTFIGAAIMAIIGTLPLLAFHLWISFAWGMGASIGIGGGGILLSALMATSLGNRIWPFVPWAWPIRLTGLTGAYSYQMTSSGFVISQAIKGLVPAGIFFVVMFAGGLIWFTRWEGRKIYE